MQQAFIPASLRTHRKPFARLVQAFAARLGDYTVVRLRSDRNPALEILDRMPCDDHAIAAMLAVEFGASKRGLAREDVAFSEPVRPIRHEAAMYRSRSRVFRYPVTRRKRPRDTIGIVSRCRYDNTGGMTAHKRKSSRGTGMSAVGG